MKIESKLSKYNGYVPKLLNGWKSQLNTSDQCISKILKSLWILDSREIRALLRNVVKENIKLIESENCFICKFGPVGKSGEVLLYEFTHTFRKYKRKIIESWNIPSLPENSIIIFLDDLVGTGTQSTNYINEKVIQVLNPSHVAYLLCMCATPQGINNVEENTNFIILPAAVLNQSNYQYLSEECRLFDQSEKDFLIDLNRRLHDPDVGYYEFLGLLLAFYFTVPNNTLPFIWKNKAIYLDENGEQKEWQALLPRYY